MIEPVAAASCEHQFIFLRQEKTNEGYDRNPVWAYHDVFFCEKCLVYEKVKVRETVNARDHFGEVTTWKR